MPWARFDERFPSHRRIRRLTDAAFRLHVSAVCWSCEYLTNGQISEHDLSEVSEVRKPLQSAEELVDAGRWHRPGHTCPSEHCWQIADGWLIHDFLDYNPSREEVEAKRAADAERKRKGRTSASRKRPRGHTADSERIPSGGATESDRRPSVPSPVVTNVTTSTRPDPVGEIATISGGTAQTLVAEWLDHCSEKVPKQVIGQVAKQLGLLLDEGQPYELVRRGLATWNERNLHASLLPSIVFEVSKGSRRANKATERLAERLAVVAHLEAEERGEIA